MKAPVVEAASVSDLQGGERQLLLRTDMGGFHFRIPAGVAAGIFRVTNPRCEHMPAGQKHPRVEKPADGT